MANYSISIHLTGIFESIISLTKKALIAEGLGILTEIDVKQTLKKKLDVEYPNYIILGACHPQSAYQALESEKEIGLLLPCNVIVYEDGEKITVSAIRPTVAMQMITNADVATIAQEVEEKLQNVINRLEGSGNE